MRAERKVRRMLLEAGSSAGRFGSTVARGGVANRKCTSMNALAEAVFRENMSSANWFLLTVYSEKIRGDIRANE